MIHLGTLRWLGYPGLPGYNHEGPYETEAEGDATTEVETVMMLPAADGGRATAEEWEELGCRSQDM